MTRYTHNVDSYGPSCDALYAGFTNFHQQVNKTNVYIVWTKIRFYIQMHSMMALNVKKPLTLFTSDI